MQFQVSGKYKYAEISSPLLSLSGFHLHFYDMKLSLLLSISSAIGAFANTFPGREIQFSMIDGDTITGLESDGIEYYRGIPFGQPPLGNLRFRPSIPYNGSLDGIKATDYGPTCYNQNIFKVWDLQKPLLPFIKWFTPSLLDVTKNSDQSEDCLNLNIYRPAGTPANAKLPVVVWVFGGAFQYGGAATYPGDKWVRDSINLGEPVVFVTFNYRLGPFGFLGGNAIADEGSGNPAIWDVVNAFKWVKANIASFGGDPTRVTAMGESSGAMMIGHTMLTPMFKRDNLFHAAVMESGSLLPLGPVDAPRTTDLFWVFAEKAGCAISSGRRVTEEEALFCLRNADTRALYDAQTYDNSVANAFDVANAFITWGPRQDGYVIEKNPLVMIRENKFPDIPLILGTQEDEGTLISLIVPARGDDQFDDKMREWFPDAGEALETSLRNYPRDKTEGSPFNTGFLNELYPGFKRSSAFLTDLLYLTPRRAIFRFTEHRKAPIYGYMSDALHNILPGLGTTHASCIFFQFFLDKVYPSRAYRGYFLSFANHHDPNINNGGVAPFPVYDERTRQLSRISFGNGSTLKDDFRINRTDLYLNNLDVFQTY